MHVDSPPYRPTPLKALGNEQSSLPPVPNPMGFCHRHGNKDNLYLTHPVTLKGTLTNFGEVFLGGTTPKVRPSFMRGNLKHNMALWAINTKYSHKYKLYA